MSKVSRNRRTLHPAAQPGILCFAMLGLALMGLFLMIVRLAEHPSVAHGAIVLAMVCAPLLCLKSRA